TSSSAFSAAIASWSPAISTAFADTDASAISRKVGERPTGYVAAHVLAFELNHIRRLVGRGNRLRQRVGNRGDCQHSTPIGHELSITHRGAGMKNFHASFLHRPCYFEVRWRAAFDLFQSENRN